MYYAAHCMQGWSPQRFPHLRGLCHTWCFVLGLRFKFERRLTIPMWLPLPPTCQPLGFGCRLQGWQTERLQAGTATWSIPSRATYNTPLPGAAALAGCVESSDICISLAATDLSAKTRWMCSLCDRCAWSASVGFAASFRHLEISAQIWQRACCVCLLMRRAPCQHLFQQRLKTL